MALAVGAAGGSSGVSADEVYGVCSTGEAVRPAERCGGSGAVDQQRRWSERLAVVASPDTVVVSGNLAIAVPVGAAVERQASLPSARCAARHVVGRVDHIVQVVVAEDAGGWTSVCDSNAPMSIEGPKTRG